MLRPRIIPVLLLDSRRLVKTVKFSSPKYVGDPINAVRVFNGLQVDELIILDISTNLKTGPDIDYIQDVVSECFMPVTYGGGISSPSHIKDLFRVGIEKLSFNRTFFTNPDLISFASRTFGAQSVVLSLDVVKRRLHSGYKVLNHRRPFYQ